jgi:hypothetical protein
MFGLPMEIVGPVVGIGAIILFVAVGIVMVRVLTSKLTHSGPKDPWSGPNRTRPSARGCGGPAW